jgi:hypothetical protein
VTKINAAEAVAPDHAKLNEQFRVSAESFRRSMEGVTQSLRGFAEVLREQMSTEHLRKAIAERFGELDPYIKVEWELRGEKPTSLPGGKSRETVTLQSVQPGVEVRLPRAYIPGVLPPTYGARAQALVELPNTLRVLSGYRRGIFTWQAIAYGFSRADVEAAKRQSVATGDGFSIEQDTETGELQLWVGENLVAQLAREDGE